MTKKKAESDVLIAGWAKLTQRQREVFGWAVHGRDVVDLGCGEMELSVEALKAGARSVLAIDKQPPTKARKLSRKMEFRQAYFADIREAPDLLLLSWPVNWSTPGLLALARAAKGIVYIGSNTDGNACGTPDLFREFETRDLLAYIPTKANTLIVLGTWLHGTRKPTAEEAHGLIAMTPVPGQKPPVWVAEPEFVSPLWSKPVTAQARGDE